MSELLKIVLSLSLSGTLLFSIILALKPLYKNKLSKRWQYYIWLIVIVRMLLPFTPETTPIGSAFEYLDNIHVETIQTTPSTNDTPGDFDSNGNYVPPDAKPQEQNPIVTTTPSLFIQGIFSKTYENLWIVWAAIAFAFLIRKITMYQSFVRFVKAGRTEVPDIEILNMLADAGETIGVKRPVELFINPLISSPMLLGFFRPYVILPSIQLEKTELAYIMQHELTHYKHMDMLYKWLVQLTVCLHWFNPFAYLLAKEINKCCELSCDEAIIRTMDKDEKKAYGDTLLNALKGMGSYKDKLASVTLTEGAEQIKERLDAIMKFNKKSKLIVIITLMLTVTLCIGATAIGAYAVTPTTETLLWVMGGTGQPYTYSQQGYYQGKYIFELGWNLDTKGYEAYSDKAKLKLSDLTTITVSFDKSCKSEMQNKEVLADLKELIESLKTQHSNSSTPLEKPLVVSVNYIGHSDLAKLAKEYYANGELTRFSAIFSSLDLAVQKEYCTKMIKKGKTAFLSSCAENMKPDMLDYCAEKTYQKGKIALFCCIAPYLSNDQKQTWIVRASRDGKNTFLSVLNQQSAHVQNRQNVPYNYTNKMNFSTSKYFFKNSYIIKMEWNINPNNYPKTILLEVFGKNLTIALNERTKDAPQNPEIIEAIKQSFTSQLKEYQNNNYLWADILSPAITEISGPYSQSADDLAYKFYDENNMHYFRAVLPYIEQSNIKVLYKRAYQENNTTFFKELLSYLPDSEKSNILSYTSVRNSQAFLALVRELSSDQQLKLAEQLYQNNDVQRFKTIMGELSTDTLEMFFKRAYQDDKATFLKALKGQVSSEVISEVLLN